MRWPWSKPPTVMAQCGHETLLRKTISVNGREAEVDLMPPAGQNPEYCIDCLMGMSIQCAWCSKLIMAGSPITLWGLQDGREAPEHAVAYTGPENYTAYVGCMHCADSVMDRSGFWMAGDNGKGQVVRVASVAQAVSILMEPVVVSDVRDFNEAIRLTNRVAERMEKIAPG